MIDELKIVKGQLEKDALKKLDQIKEKILTHTEEDPHVGIEILAMVNDDLSDVLLNWEPRYLDDGLGDDLM